MSGRCSKQITQIRENNGHRACCRLTDRLLLSAVSIFIAAALVFIARELRRIFVLFNRQQQGFSALYPVFTKTEIDDCQRELRLEDRRYTQLWEYIEHRDDFKAHQVGPVTESLFFDCALAKLRVDHLRRLNSLQIEGNASVFSGQWTIQECAFR